MCKTSDGHTHTHTHTLRLSMRGLRSTVLRDVLDSVDSDRKFFVVVDVHIKIDKTEKGNK